MTKMISDKDPLFSSLEWKTTLTDLHLIPILGSMTCDVLHGNINFYINGNPFGCNFLKL